MTLNRERGNTAMAACIRLAAAGARGEACQAPERVWTEGLSVAAEQMVLPLAACAMLDGGAATCPSAVRERCLAALRNAASANAIRRQRILRLIQEMEDAGFQVCVLKGLSVARLYAYPESRGSVDTDLLIDPAQEKAVYAFLAERGFTIMGRRATANDGICTHPQYGKIEIHPELHPELPETAWKEFVRPEALQQEPWIRVHEQGGSFSALGHTDQLIFLALHMVKHFVEGGLSIGMMLDAALHFSRFHQEIDAERFWGTMRALKCDGCMTAILWIMIRDGGFREEDFPGIGEPAADSMDGILRDLETGGYMGVKAPLERLESGMEYYRRMILKNRSDAQYRRYMLSWKTRSARRYMFPTYQRLKELYPWCGRCPILAPAAWLYQMVRYPVSKIRAGVLRRDIRSEKSTMSAESEPRVTLFEKLGML